MNSRHTVHILGGGFHVSRSPLSFHAQRIQVYFCRPGKKPPEEPDFNVPGGLGVPFLAWFLRFEEGSSGQSEENSGELEARKHEAEIGQVPLEGKTLVTGGTFEFVCLFLIISWRFGSFPRRKCT